jgi:hypothetical protein
VFGTDDDTELHAAINGRISSSEYGWQYPDVQDAQLWAESYSVTYLGEKAWQVQINYEKGGAEPETPDPLKRSRSFDTTGGTQHITQGRKNWLGLLENRYPPEAPDQKGAIGVDSNGVNGVDVVVPQLQWQETYDVPSQYVTAEYIRTVAELTGTTNDLQFRGFARGEVLFIGCTGSHEWDDQKGDGPWSLSYRFVASPNVDDEEVGSITDIAKEGHEYLWVRYEETVGSSTLLKTPKHVYVNKVYKDGNFELLGIGT